MLQLRSVRPESQKKRDTHEGEATEERFLDSLKNARLPTLRGGGIVVMNHHVVGTEETLREAGENYSRARWRSSARSVIRRPVSWRRKRLARSARSVRSSADF